MLINSYHKTMLYLHYNMVILGNFAPYLLQFSLILANMTNILRILVHFIYSIYYRLSDNFEILLYCEMYVEANC